MAAVDRIQLAVGEGLVGKGQGATPLHGELTWGQRGGWGSLKKGLHSDSGRVEVHARGGRRRG